MNRLKLLIMLIALTGWSFGQDHLLISEVAVEPSNPVNQEFIEIYNPTAATISLENYYLSDNNEYYKWVDSSLSLHSTDFLIQFPNSASIAPGEVIVIAFDGSVLVDADFEVINQNDNVPDMVGISVSNSSGLTDSGEMLMLFFWDGQTDLVEDVDYLSWGNNTDRFTDKSGLGIDGPDAGNDSSVYLADTPVGSQLAVTVSHGDGESFQRITATETGRNCQRRQWFNRPRRNQ